MQKLAVLGNSGGGKSTLSRKLSTELGVPYFSVDSALWNPAEGKVPGEEVARRHTQWLSLESWIIDGWGDFSLIEQRLADADSVILIEHPLWRHCWWAAKRECHNVLKRTLLGQRPPEVLEQTWQLIKAIRWVRRTGLPWLKGRLSQPEIARKLLTINSPECIHALLKNPRAHLSAPQNLSTSSSGSSSGPEAPMTGGDPARSGGDPARV